MPIDAELLEILQCPKCQGEVCLSDSGGEVACKCCGLLYEIKDGIPIMLVEESKRIDGQDDPEAPQSSD